MYLNWKNGIPTHEFKKQSAKDMWLMVDIDSAIQNKQIRMAKVREALLKARGI